MTFTDLQQRYVDLLIGSLTRSMFGEGGQPVPEARQKGRDWPPEAETMIGVERCYDLADCVATVIDDGVPGDCAEAGVWRGGACILMRGLLHALGQPQRNVWVCDSFAGLPRPDPRYPYDAADNHWSQTALRIPIGVVKANFARYRLDDPEVRYLQGWFEDTLPGPIQQLALLRLDGDMYSSTIHTLSALYPLVSPGGIVIVDDFGGHGSNCQKAVEHYRDTHGVTAPIEMISDSGACRWRA